MAALAKYSTVKGVPQHARTVKGANVTSATELDHKATTSRTVMDDDIERLGGNFRTLRIVATPSEKITGADVPVHARMVVQHTGLKTTDFTIKMFEPGASKPAFALPINRSYYHTGKAGKTAAVALLKHRSKDELFVSVSGYTKTFDAAYQLDNVMWWS